MTDFELNSKVISSLTDLNQKMPHEYLRRNHVQYEYVCYVSLIGTLFLSGDFVAVATFIKRANIYLTEIDNSLLDSNYLEASKRFITVISDYIPK
ncbi:hypothetical protein GCM10027043_52770 [Ferruginibacter profundus]